MVHIKELNGSKYAFVETTATTLKARNKLVMAGLPEGDYSIIGIASSLKDEHWKEILPPSDDFMYKDYTGTYAACGTAYLSGLSLVASLGMEAEKTFILKITDPKKEEVDPDTYFVGKVAYELSKDYNTLFDLLNKGMEIAVFVDYTYRDGGPTLRDIARLRGGKYNYQISARGISYDHHPIIESDSPEEKFKSFIMNCQKSNLEWIVPHVIVNKFVAGHHPC